MPGRGSSAGQHAGLWWLALLAAVAVLAASAFVFLRALTPQPHESVPPLPSVPASEPPLADPSATPSQPPSSVGAPQVIRSTTPGGLLPDGGGGDVYAQTAGAVFRVELASGRITRTPTPNLQAFNSFVAGPGWVVSKTVDDATGVVVRVGQAAQPLPKLLQTPGRLNPGPNGRLWLQPEPPDGAADTISLVTVDGRRVPGQTARVDTSDGDYIFGSDGAGHLLKTNAGGVYQVSASGMQRITRGVALGIGRRQLLIWDCDRAARCAPALLDRVSGQRTQLPKLKPSLLRLFDGISSPDAGPAGDLSSDGRYAALTGLTASGQAALHVVDLRTGRTQRAPGAVTDTNANAQFAWTPNGRWLLAVTNHQIRAIEARTGATRTLRLDGEPVLHLTALGASG